MVIAVDISFFRDVFFPRRSESKFKWLKRSSFNFVAPYSYYAFDANESKSGCCIGFGVHLISIRSRFGGWHEV
jgi:hypothetical protein